MGIEERKDMGVGLGRKVVEAWRGGILTTCLKNGWVGEDKYLKPAKRLSCY